MTSIQQKTRLASALAVLAILAIGAGCTGFFPKATLQSITISPQSPQVLLSTPNQTALQVFGTDSNNNRTQITSGITWSTSPAGVVSIDANGVPNGQSLSTTTITAEVQGLTTTASATVTVGCIQQITVTPASPGAISVIGGGSIQFAASAVTCNGTVDISNVATWTSNNTATATIDSTGFLIPLAAGTTIVTANSDGITSNSVTVTVTP